MDSVVLPQGFRFASAISGIKASGRPDLAVIMTDAKAVMAGVYTQNVVRAASIDWNRAITPTDQFRGLIVNSGNANACTGQQGIDDNRSMAEQLANQLGTEIDSIGVMSTGVIGHHLPMDLISQAIPGLAQSTESTVAGFEGAAEAILTTDQSIKIASRVVTIEGDEISIVGMAKGAGMIGPDMATMLGVVCVDAKLNPDDAQAMIAVAADHSFNRISVEGHTSTNDALMLIASGEGPDLTTCSAEADPASGAAESKSGAGSRLELLQEALNEVCIELAKKIPADGEGASHLLTILVRGAETAESADRVARTIAASNLVKTAVTGADPNWGRIMSAAGYSGERFDPAQTELKINGFLVFKDGEPVEFDAVKVSASMKQQFETQIELEIGQGVFDATHWTSDLTVAYVQFNSEYTT